MRKFLATIMLVMFCATSATAQIGKQGDVVAGLTGNWYFPGETMKDTRQSGFGLDFLGGSYIADNVFVNSGLGYMMSWVNVDVIEHETFSFSLCLPMCLGYRLPLGGDDSPSISFYTGPSLSYAIAGHVKIGRLTDYEKIKFSEMDNVKRFNTSWKFGAVLNFADIGISFQYISPMGEGADDHPGMIGIGIGVLY